MYINVFLICSMFFFVTEATAMTTTTSTTTTTKVLLKYTIAIAKTSSEFVPFKKYIKYRELTAPASKETSEQPTSSLNL